MSVLFLSITSICRCWVIVKDWIFYQCWIFVTTFWTSWDINQEYLSQWPRNIKTFSCCYSLCNLFFFWEMFSFMYLLSDLFVCFLLIFYCINLMCLIRHNSYNKGLDINKCHHSVFTEIFRLWLVKSN